LFELRWGPGFSFWVILVSPEQTAAVQRFGDCDNVTDRACVLRAILSGRI
jgi:hypothetical protein